MARFQESIEVNAPARVCYQQWMRFEEFSRFMKYINCVTQEWDAVDDGEEPARLISWHSISEPDVDIQGAVLFETLSQQSTRVTSAIQYEPFAAAVEELVGEIFSNPQQKLRQDLEQFKQLMERRLVSSASRSY